jgi:hypothetical protein
MYAFLNTSRTSESRSFLWLLIVVVFIWTKSAWLTWTGTLSQSYLSYKPVIHFLDFEMLINKKLIGHIIVVVGSLLQGCHLLQLAISICFTRNLSLTISPLHKTHLFVQVILVLNWKVQVFMPFVHIGDFWLSSYGFWFTIWLEGDNF